MRIIYCHSCDEVFAETEMIIPGHCPLCGAHDVLEVIDCKRGMELSDRLIEDLWAIYRDYLCYGEDDETIAEDFLDFPAGTKLPVIWKWFDEAYSKGVHELINM